MNINSVFISFMIISFLAGIISWLGFTLQSSSWNSNMLTGFESGFAQHLFMHKSFNLQIFLILLIFVCFDLEVIFLSIICFSILSLHLFSFLGFILFTLWLEFWLGSIAWKIY